MKRAVRQLIVTTSSLAFLVAGSASAQQGGGAVAEEGAFAQNYPGAAQLLGALMDARVRLYQELLSDRANSARIEEEFLEQVLDQARAGAAGEGGASVADAGELRRIAPNLPRVLEAVEAFHGQLLDIYADDSVTDKGGAVTAAVDRYLALGEVALSPIPKDMGIMVDYPYATDFEERFPRANALVWAADWLSIGVFEPLMMFPTAEEKANGVASTISRFAEMLGDPPETSPSHMPMAPTMGPNFVSRHPRAAAILDNYHMLQDVLLDIIASDAVSDRLAVGTETVQHFIDRDHLAIEEIDWIWMALRHGIYAQGGPAIGKMERPDRTGTHEHGGGNMVLPGM